MRAATETRPVDSPAPASGLPALAVDLDGSLIKTDLLLESVVTLLKQEPWRALLLPLWLLRGKAYLKRQVARRVSMDVTALPYRQDLLDYLTAQRKLGRTLVLATASDRLLARQVADHLGIFDSVLASDGTNNLSGNLKRDRLVSQFGEKGFDYAGNGRCDLVVWAAARKAIVVDPTRSVEVSVARVAEIDHVFQERKKGLRDLIRPLRLQHWLKNILIFLPLLSAHEFFELPLLGKALLAFLSFGCLASGGYVVNDLFDLQADRRHPTKRLRPFAAGDLPLSFALLMAPVLIGVGCLLAVLVSPLFLASALTYLVLTLAYSLYLKRIVILDVIVLAGLYTIRLMAGSAAVAIWPSHWLLAFSVFLFFSLALVKRYGELVVMRRLHGDEAKARGYEMSDGELLAGMGVASGYLAILVFALYITTDTARFLYGRYELMWFLCPLLLYWISHVWLIAHRGKMPDDPVVFAVNDRTSRILILLMLVVTVLAL